MWTRELRYHRHSQILGSPSKYSQRHREHGCAYNVKGDEAVNGNAFKNGRETLVEQAQETGSYLHQSDGLPGLYAFLVNEYQNANDGTNKAETSHEAGYN